MKPLHISSILLIVAPLPAAFAVNFQQCLAIVNNMTIDGKVDNHGNPLAASSTNATAITYDLCVSACGSSQIPFEWSAFAQQFSSWILPWLALVSQLPFGANDKLDNLESMVLTVGSPMLAGYSLVLTALNGRWVARTFANIRYPNARNAAKVLIGLQQAPLRVNAEKSKLAALVVFPQNDEWWEELVAWLDYTPKWSIAAATSIAWVIIAYAFTLADYFSEKVLENKPPNDSGIGVGSIGTLWLWLLPVIVGWMQISPNSDSTRLDQALDRANSIAYVGTKDSIPRIARLVHEKCAITLERAGEDATRRDEHSTPPIFNYARYFPWVENVMLISSAFRHAAEKHHSYQEFHADRGEQPYLRPRNLTSLQVEEYCMAVLLRESEECHRLDPSVFSRMFIATACAIMLQWGTTGAAVIISWYSPTIGLGCRSGAYFIYASVSTLIWSMLLVSVFLAYYTRTRATSRQADRSKLKLFVGLHYFSIFLRRSAKVLATLNALWIVAVGVLQLSNVFSTCYCNSCVISLGNKAYNVISLTPKDVDKLRAAWIFGFSLSAAVVAVFSVTITIFTNPPLPRDLKY